jgi:hypothetical protein
MIGRAAVLVICAMTMGCYATTQIDLRKNPELRAIHIGAPEEAYVISERTVEARVKRFGGPCGEMITEALKKLLDEAKAIGADEVHSVVFRGRAKWVARPICYVGIMNHWVEVRGVAGESP